MADEFIETFQNMYEEGKQPGPAGLAVGAAGADGDTVPYERYDPKARVFLGENEWAYASHG